jgi:exodeoxyribonuclease V gamma subunit
MPGLYLFTSNRMEALAELLAEALREPQASPLAPEIVGVQSRGMERWVAMALARHNGVCANVRFPFPNALLDEVFHRLTPGAPEASGPDPEALAFRLMRLLPRELGRPEFAGLRAYLSQDPHQLKLYQLSRRLADLFDQYAVFRPAMLLRWEAGRIDPDPTERWQARLWRALIAEAPGAHRARLTLGAIAGLRAGEACSECLPERIALFGISFLPPFYLECFEALSRVVRINLFLLNPCREYWGEIVSEKEIRRIEERHPGAALSGADFHLERGNRLLASLGALGRGFFETVAGLGAVQTERFDEPGGETALERLQADVLNLRDGRGSAGEAHAPAPDESIRIHSCHGPMREMEVLHDQLLAAFEQDPRLRPVDVVVMAPDIGVYAPYISAVFGAPEEERERIPYSIADRGPAGGDPVAAALLALLDLKGSRLGAAEVMGLLELPAIRDRFELPEDRLPLIAHWVREARIRWGEDERSRAALGLPGHGGNSWRSGLQRLVLGYAMPARDGRLFEGILAFDDIEGGPAWVLGNFMEFTDRVFELVRRLARPQTLVEWRRTLLDVLADFVAGPAETAPESRRIQRLLDELGGLEPEARFGAPVTLEVVRGFLSARLDRERIGHGFLSGGVTFCALLPMRSIPFQVVCLIGMNHDAFPRIQQPLSFDLIARNPRPGDRSRRNDDKYLFLEALLAARKRLYISFVGQSIADNSSLPPSVLVAELIDVVANGYAAQGEAGRPPAPLVTAHRLQAFSRAYFEERTALFSYSRVNLLACSGAGNRRPPPPFFERPLPCEDEAAGREVGADDLCAFLSHPAGFLVRQRLGIRLSGGGEPTLEEREPFVLDPLSAYRIGQSLLERHLAGQDPAALFECLRAGGDLPHGRVGEYLFARLNAQVAQFAARVLPVLPTGAAEIVEIERAIGGFRLNARLSAHPGHGCVKLRYAKVAAKDFLRAWIDHLYLSLGESGRAPRRSLLIGRDCAWALGRVETAPEVLAGLLSLYRRGLTQPIRFFPETSLAWFLRAGRVPGDERGALAAARQRWVGGDYVVGESADPYHRLCFGQTEPLDEEFTETARAVYGPLFDHCAPISW